MDSFVAIGGKRVMRGTLDGLYSAAAKATMTAYQIGLRLQTTLTSCRKQLVRKVDIILSGFKKKLVWKWFFVLPLTAFAFGVIEVWIVIQFLGMAALTCRDAFDEGWASFAGFSDKECGWLRLQFLACVRYGVHRFP